MTTFNELASTLPFGEFMRLQSQIMNPDTSKYVRVVTGATRVTKGQHGSQIGSVKYEPQEGGKFVDAGEISTNWLTDPVATLICKNAVEWAGSRCLIYQLNKDKSEEQPSGFREIIWLERLADAPNPRQASAGPDPVTVSPPVAHHDEPFNPTSRVQDHLGTPPVEYHDEPFRINAADWWPDQWGEYPS